ncbi:MAG TPA: hypothetical protein VGS22_11160 [Thermoanaerobaculia bacterium]|jgi:hypothetical protein|nr:hypothetical protein [Thermoanaerobaculia bacterium]
MPEPRKFLTADERLRQLEKDRKILRRERMIREVAGPVWHRMVRVFPRSFEAEGRLVAREILASREVVIEALKAEAVFAVDTAMRLAHGAGFLAVQEVQAYLVGKEPLDRLAAAGLISGEDYFDRVLVRPWPGPTRLLACLVDELPPSREVQGGYRVVTRERLGQELVGTVGPRADLFVLYEKVEGIEASS